MKGRIIHRAGQGRETEIGTDRTARPDDTEQGKRDTYECHRREMNEQHDLGSSHDHRALKDARNPLPKDGLLRGTPKGYAGVPGLRL